jgi:hypothetical protein
VELARALESTLEARTRAMVRPLIAAPRPFVARAERHAVEVGKLFS